MDITLALNPDHYATPCTIQVDPYVGDGTDTGAWEVLDAGGEHVVTRPNRREAQAVAHAINTGTAYGTPRGRVIYAKNTKG